MRGGCRACSGTQLDLDDREAVNGVEQLRLDPPDGELPGEIGFGVFNDQLAVALVGEVRHEGAHALAVDDQRVTDLALKVGDVSRSEEHTSELQSRGLISYAVFCLKKKKKR